MIRARTVPQMMQAPRHGGDLIPCHSVTECAIHTIELDEGHFASLVFSRPGSQFGVIAILDRDEVEAHIVLLRNAMDDAERLDAGKPPIHASPSARHH